MSNNDSGHGCKKGKFLVPIKKTLEEGELSGKDLFNEAKKLIPTPSFFNPENSFIEALHCLLANKTIQIEEYNKGLDPRGTKHSFTYKYFIFSLVKTEPLQIFTLFQELNDSNTHEEAKNKIFKIFKRKIEEIELENLEKWEEFKGKIEVRKPTHNELLWFKAGNEACEYIETHMTGHEKDADYDDIYYFQIEKNMEKYKEEIPSIIEEYKNFNLNILSDYPKDLIEDSIIPKSLRYPHIFTDEELDEEGFLHKVHLKLPHELTYEEINRLFHMDLLLNINSQPNAEKIKLIKKTAVALSDQNNSKELFNELIEEISENNIELIEKYELL